MNSLPISRKLYYTIFGGVVIFCYPIGAPVQFGRYSSTAPRPEKTIIVTGATGNLGHATTHEFARRGCRVIMACRDMDKCKSIRREIVLLTRNHSIACRHLDLEDIDSINKFADEIIEKEPHVDVLVNMAAVKELEQKELTKYGIEKHFFVNFLAQYLLTLKLIPKLEESAKETKDSRIINVIGKPKKSWHIDLNDINFTKRKYKNKEAYNQSKLALAYFTILLDKFNRAKGNHVHVFGTSPGTNRILPMNEFKTGYLYELSRIKTAYCWYDPRIVTQRNIYCALDKSLVKDNLYGRNFNFYNNAVGWNNGWGVAGVNEDKAKLVWNLAADWLINAKLIAETCSESVASSVPPSETKGLGGQVKAQGNNKASDVLVSA